MGKLKGKQSNSSIAGTSYFRSCFALGNLFSDNISAQLMFSWLMENKMQRSSLSCV